VDKNRRFSPVSREEGELQKERLKEARQAARREKNDRTRAKGGNGELRIEESIYFNRDG